MSSNPKDYLVAGDAELEKLNVILVEKDDILFRIVLQDECPYFKI